MRIAGHEPFWGVWPLGGRVLWALLLVLFAAAWTGTASAETVEELEAAQQACLASQARWQALYDLVYTDRNMLRLEEECNNAYRESGTIAFALEKLITDDPQLRAKTEFCDSLRARYRSAYSEWSNAAMSNKARERSSYMISMPPLSVFMLEHEARRCDMERAELLRKLTVRYGPERERLEARYREALEDEELAERRLQFALSLPGQLKSIAEACSEISRQLAEVRDARTREQARMQINGPSTATEGQVISYGAGLPQSIGANLPNVQYSGGYVWTLDGRALPGSNNSVSFPAPAPGVHKLSARFWIVRGVGRSEETLAEGAVSFTVSATPAPAGTCAKWDLTETWWNLVWDYAPGKQYTMVMHLKRQEGNKVYGGLSGVSLVGTLNGSQFSFCASVGCGQNWTGTLLSPNEMSGRMVQSKTQTLEAGSFTWHATPQNKYSSARCAR